MELLAIILGNWQICAVGVGLWWLSRRPSHRRSMLQFSLPRRTRRKIRRAIRHRTTDRVRLKVSSHRHAANYRMIVDRIDADGRKVHCHAQSSGKRVIHIQGLGPYKARSVERQAAREALRKLLPKGTEITYRGKLTRSKTWRGRVLVNGRDVTGPVKRAVGAAQREARRRNRRR